MKLYATVTSERASKSQGGNKKIEIKLQRDRNRAEYHVLYTPDGHISVSVPTDTGGAEIFNTKGEKKKDNHKCKAGETFTNRYGEQELPACICK